MIRFIMLILTEASMCGSIGGVSESGMGGVGPGNNGSLTVGSSGNGSLVAIGQGSLARANHASRCYCLAVYCHCLTWQGYSTSAAAAVAHAQCQVTTPSCQKKSELVNKMLL